jgi:Big-like domain-containing protein
MPKPLRSTLRARTGTLVLALALSMCLACATIEQPTGGPEDKTPPEVLRISPDSASVGLRGVDKLVLEFSEKVDPKPAERVLKFYPDLEVKKTKWHARRTMEVIFTDTLPADTVIVVELPPGFTDVHRVKMTSAHVYPLATADSLPKAYITGSLIHKNEPAAGAVVELYDVPPDTLDWSRQPILRRAATDSNGVFTLPWLQPGGGPYLLRAFVDRNQDYRAAENEPQRLLPGEFIIPMSPPIVNAGLFIVYAPTDPGLISTVTPDSISGERRLFGWPTKIAEEDTGFVPMHSRTPPGPIMALTPGDTTLWDTAGPGLVRAIFFTDLDGDSLLSAVATDTLVIRREMPDTASADSTATMLADVDSIVWKWEPWALADSIKVEPGLETRFDFPALDDSLRPCLTPPPPIPVFTPPDTLAALTDSLTAFSAMDSLGTAIDSLTISVPVDSLDLPNEVE